MNILSKILIFLMMITTSSSVLSMEFQHFKLTDKFQQKTQRLKAKAARSMRSLKANGIIEDNNFEVSPLLAEIAGMLAGNHDNIGLAQTQRLLENHDLGGGTLNFSGFTWYKPMLNYNLAAHREVAPHLYSDQWIVQDKFVIYIEAATLLSNLKDDGLINISEKTIGAFAGLSFTRTYHFYHFTDSYLDGIGADFSKLFLGFQRFSPEKILDLTDHEVIKTTDEFQFNAGGIAAAPVGANALLQFGFLARKTFKKEIQIQKVAPEEAKYDDEKIRVSITKDKKTSFNSHLSLQYDFYNLLKITLLSYDLEYEYGKSLKEYSSFSKQDLVQINSDDYLKKSFKKMIEGNSQRVFKENLVGKEERMKENLNSKFSFLLFGSMKKRATEQITIINDNIEKTFFKAYSESVKYVDNLFSRLYSRVINKIFDLSPIVSKNSQEKKKLEMEYEKVHHLRANMVENTEQFSLELGFEWHAQKTHKWYNRGLRKRTVANLKNFANLSSDLISKVRSKIIRGPLTLSTKVQIGQNALDYFMETSEEELLSSILEVCSIPSKEWKPFFNKRKRKRIFRKRENRRNRNIKCVKILHQRQEDFFSHYQRYQEFDLSKFKKFLGYFYSKSKGLDNLYSIFGKENLFIHGSLGAKTKSGRNFHTFFKSGQFSGLGVIDSFKYKTM